MNSQTLGGHEAAADKENTMKAIVQEGYRAPERVLKPKRADWLSGAIPVDPITRSGRYRSSPRVLPIDQALMWVIVSR